MSRSSQTHSRSQFDLRVLLRIADRLERRLVQKMLEQLGCTVAEDDDRGNLPKRNSDFDLLIAMPHRDEFGETALKVSCVQAARKRPNGLGAKIGGGRDGARPLPRPVRLRDLEGVLKDFAAPLQRDPIDEHNSFASLVDPSVLKGAALQFSKDIRAFLDFPSLERPRDGARKAHSFISTAVVLALPALAEACQRFEASVADDGDCRAALGRLRENIREALVALGEQP